MLECRARRQLLGARGWRGLLLRRREFASVVIRCWLDFGVCLWWRCRGGSGAAFEVFKTTLQLLAWMIVRICFLGEEWKRTHGSFSVQFCSVYDDAQQGLRFESSLHLDLQKH